MFPPTPAPRPGVRPGIRCRSVLVALCGVLLAWAPGPALAAEVGRTITLGESNTTAQREELLAYFEAGDDDRVSDVTLADTQRAMDGIIDVTDITSAYSSTALRCGEAGSGLVVRTRNIEVVPPGLYAMALATAGIDDAMLVVAAPDDAPAEGMTALTGVFQTWDLAPCGGASLDPDRQALALEELALAMRIGVGLSGDTGAQDATDLLLAIQRRIIVNRPEGRSGVVEAIEAEERALGVSVADTERDDAVDLMARLASERIDWGSFEHGWTLEQGEGAAGVTLRASEPEGQQDGVSAPTPTPSATATPPPAVAPGTVDTSGGATGASVGSGQTEDASGGGMPTGLLGLGTVGLLACVAGGLWLARRRRPRAEIAFVPRARPAAVAASRLRVVGPDVAATTRMWYRPRSQPRQPDGTAT